MDEPVVAGTKPCLVALVEGAALPLVHVRAEPVATVL